MDNVQEGMSWLEATRQAFSRFFAGVIPLMRFFFCLARARKSHSTWMPCQNVSDWPKKSPKRIDMDGVIARLPRTISLMARGGTPMARAMAF